MNKLLWLSDIHLNFLSPDSCARFLAEIGDLEPQAILLSGDICEAPQLTHYLHRLAEAWTCPVYFVLGNHDYYFGSIREVRAAVRAQCAELKHLVWLTESEPRELVPGVGVVGHDGWADARLGDYERSLVMMNDYRLIAELAAASKASRWTLLKSMGDAAAAWARQVLPAALERWPHVVFVTHVPPLREACWYQGQISNDEWLPHFSCLAMGQAVLEVARRFPERQLTVLCGHTHSPGQCQPLANLRIFTAQAEYGVTEVQTLWP